MILALSAPLPARAGVQSLAQQPVDAGVPQISSAGQVAWRSGPDLFLWENGRTRQLSDVTNNAYILSPPYASPSSDPLPWHLNDTGQLVWQGWDGSHDQVFLWNGASVRQLSQGSQDNRHPQINHQGQVVWEGGGQIYLWDGASVQQLTTGVVQNITPQINDAGEVVWAGSGDIYFWDAGNTRQLTHGDAQYSTPRINSSGQVVWVSNWNSGARRDVYLWDGSVTRQLAIPGILAQGPQLSDSGQVVWQGFQINTQQTKIWLWDGAQVRQLTGVDETGSNDHINPTGKVVWTASNPSMFPWNRLYMWDGSSVHQISGQQMPAGDPQINAAGQVIWQRSDGSSHSLLLWDGHSSRPITPDRLTDGYQNFAIDERGQVAWIAAGQVYLYTPPAPGSVELEPASVWEGDPLVGIVTLPAPAPPEGATVSLSTLSPAVAVPGSATVPPGETTVTFPLFATPVSQTTDATISAGYGSARWTAALRVLHTALASFSLDTPRVVGGNPVSGSVQLNGPAPAGGATLTVESDNPAVAAAYVNETTIEGTSRSGSFSVTTRPVASTTVVHLSVSYDGVTCMTRLTVLPNVGISTVTLDAAQVVAGQTVTGTITFSAPVPSGGADLFLSSSNLAELSVPGTIVVPAGAKSVTFTAATHPVLYDDYVSIYMRYGGGSTSAPLRIISDGSGKLSLGSIEGGQTISPFLPPLASSPTGEAVITLSSSDPTAASVAATIKLPSASWATPIVVSTQPVAVVTLVVITASYGGTTRAGVLTVLPPHLDTVTLDPARAAAGGIAPGSVSLTGPAPPAGLFVPLESSDPSVLTVPAGVTVPAGASRVTFTAAISPVSGMATAAVLAVDERYGSLRQAWLTVTPATAESILLPTDVLMSGRTVMGTVTLTGPAPAGGLEITFSSENPAAVRLPAHLIVPAGAITAAFPVTTLRVRATTPIVISASAGGTTESTSFTVIPGGIASFSLHPTRVRGSQTAMAEITLHTAAPENGAVITLTSDDPAAASPPLTVTVPPGARDIRFSVATHRVPGSRSVVIRASYAGVTQAAQLMVARR
jgi:hypothetical protein